MLTIGSRIRKRRKEMGLSQDELARRLGYKSRSSINKIELDERNLTQSKIKAIADALGTTPSYIMGWDEFYQDIDPVLREKADTKTAMEMVECQYGQIAAEAMDLYLQLDEGDQGEIRGTMKQMLKSTKYSI